MNEKDLHRESKCHNITVTTAQFTGPNESTLWTLRMGSRMVGLHPLGTCCTLLDHGCGVHSSAIPAP